MCECCACARGFQVADHLSFAKPRSVSFFETTIRALGGLLAAYELSRDQVFLDKAEDLGERLVKAFGTPSGVPHGQIHLTSGRSSNPGWTGSVRDTWVALALHCAFTLDPFDPPYRLRSSPRLGQCSSSFATCRSTSASVRTVRRPSRPLRFCGSTPSAMAYTPSTLVPRLARCVVSCEAVAPQRLTSPVFPFCGSSRGCTDCYASLRPTRLPLVPWVIPSMSTC